MVDVSEVREFRIGEWAEVRSAREILATLDAAGTLNGLPFMPEMVAFLGGRFRVHRRADKTCVEGGGIRALGGTVFLDGVRCDGAAHDGCQRGCLVFWPEAWLRPDGEPAPAIDLAAETAAREALLALPTRDGELYSCQSTALPEVTSPIAAWRYGLLADDLAKGELSFGDFLGIAWRTVANKARRMAGLPELDGIVGARPGASKGKLGLKAGDWVRIKPADEIRKTLGPDGRNRGLTFEAEMSRYIGGVYQVEEVIERIVLEETGRMAKLSRTVSLKTVSCRGLCAKNCPRANPLFWREAWLERVDPSDAGLGDPAVVNPVQDLERRAAAA